MFIWLGSGRAGRRMVGVKGALLDQAAHAGLPVPVGAILLDEFFRICLEKGLVELFDGRAIVPDPELLHNTLFHSVRLPQFQRLVAVRSSFRLSGNTPVCFPAHLNIDFKDAGKMSNALAAAWTAASGRADLTRADVLVIEMVAAEQSGTAVTRQDGRDDESTQFPDHAKDRTTQSLPKLVGWQTPSEGLPPFVRRLQMLLRGVRRTFGKGDWQIEWADDGRICQLLQVSPPTTRHHPAE